MLPGTNEKNLIDSPDKDTTRLEAFSDGVFAIAITLLGLDMRVPDPGESNKIGLGAALLEQWPVYAAFFTSFFIILVIWKSHHQLFKLVYRVNKPLFFANGLLLCAVTVIPFTTNLVAEYFHTAQREIAVMTYSLVSFPVGFGIATLLEVIMHYPEIRIPDVDLARVRAWRRRMFITSIFFVTAFVLAFIDAPLSVLIIFGAAVYWGLAKTY